MADHLRVRLNVADYSKMKFEYFAHSDECKSHEPKNIQRLRKCANKNAMKNPLKKKGNNEPH